jgi:hypothetical protein
LQRLIKRLWSGALLQTSHIHINSQWHYKNAHFSKRIHHPPTNFLVKTGHVLCRVCLSTLLWWSHLVWHLLRYILKGNFIWWVLLHKSKGTWDFIANNLLTFNSARKTFNISSIALLIRLLLLLYGV